MRFTKAETNGNDFVIIEDVCPKQVDIRKICDRHFGIGCDQIIFLHDKNVSFFNNDGSYANMCGNGLAALAKYSGKTEFVINNKKYKCELCVNGDVTVLIEVISVERCDDCYIVDIGNRHVVFSDDKYNYEQYINEYNVHYAKICDNTIHIITYERGAGRTNACGSGAVAVAAAFGMDDVTIMHDGGKSHVIIENGVAKLIVCPNIVFSGVLG